MDEQKIGQKIAEIMCDYCDGRDECPAQEADVRCNGQLALLALIAEDRAGLVEALKFVVDREHLMFAECSDAEEIIRVCKAAIEGSGK